MIRDFAENEVKPLAAEVDEQERFPIETVEKMAKIGIMGIPIPKQYGGAGGNNGNPIDINGIGGAGGNNGNPIDLEGIGGPGGNNGDDIDLEGIGGPGGNNG